MEHKLSIDLLRRLKLNGYTALVPKGKRGEISIFAITNYPIHDLENDTGTPLQEGNFLAIDELLLHEDKLTLKGIVLLPDDDLSSAL